MDPSMDLSMNTEPTFSTAQVVNHAPPPPPPQPPSYIPTPSYDEMITAAITALRERDGSSRIAIAKYIDRAYSNLPPNHSALLTHHLKRLKNSGYLAMVKHSYMLAGSAPPPPPPAVTVDANGNGGGGGDGSSLTKRKPGRPPKPKAEIQPPQQQQQQQTQQDYQAQLMAQYRAQQQQAQAQFQPNYQPQPQPQPQFFQQPQYQPQFQFQADPSFQHQFQPQPQHQHQFQPQPQPYVPEAQNFTNLGAESVFVSLGLADGPVGVSNPPPPAPMPVQAIPPEGSVTKRRPGRPRKDGSAPSEPKAPSGRRPGRPPKSNTAAPGTAPKPRGRPRGWRKGRPRKNPAPSANGGDNAANIVPPGAGPAPAPKRRGRPPRSAYQAVPISAVGVTDVPIAAAFESTDTAGATGGAVTNGNQPLGKRRGRPPRSYSADAMAPVRKLKKPRRLSGKPLGRPKKDPNAAAPAALDTKLLVVYEELKGKYEHLQSRIREATNVLRPCLNAETPAIALAAFQELEELAAVGTNPVQEAAPPPPPPTEVNPVQAAAAAVVNLGQQN